MLVYYISTIEIIKGHRESKRAKYEDLNVIQDTDEPINDKSGKITSNRYKYLNYLLIL